MTYCTIRYICIMIMYFSVYLPANLPQEKLIKLGWVQNDIVTKSMARNNCYTNLLGAFLWQKSLSGFTGPPFWFSY